MQTNELYPAVKPFIQEDLLKFIDLASNASDMERILNTAARYIGNALILIDLFGAVLCYSSDFEILDPLWAENIRQGSYTGDFSRKVRANNSMQDWSRTGQPVQEITLEGDMQPKLVARIEEDRHVMAALVMVAHHTPICSMHQQTLPILAKLIYSAYTRNHPQAPVSLQDMPYAAALFALLDNASDNGPTNLDSLDFPAEMQAVTARLVDRYDNRYIKRAFSQKMQGIFPEGHLVQKKGYICALTSGVAPVQHGALEKLALQDNARIGISWRFSDIMDFHHYFNQSVSVIKLAEKHQDKNRVVNFTNYAFYALLENYTGKYPLDWYCHPALTQLRLHDQSHHTEYYETLRTFMITRCNQKQSAEQLFIHRNTLQYRLNRITALTGLDLSESMTTWVLLISFAIEKYKS